MRAIGIACALLVACGAPPPPRVVYSTPIAAPGADAPASPVAALAPPSAVAPLAPPPARTRWYAFPMVLLDLALVISVGPVVSTVDENSRGDDSATTAVVGLYLGAYLFGGAVIHHVNGNRVQVGRSVLRRAGYPLLFGMAGGLLGAAGERDCNGELCGLATVVLAMVGVGVGGIVAIIHDWSRARVEPPSRPGVVPVITGDRDRVVVGIGGRF